MRFFLKHKTYKMAKMRVCLYKTLLETTFCLSWEVFMKLGRMMWSGLWCWILSLALCCSSSSEVFVRVRKMPVPVGACQRSVPQSLRKKHFYVQRCHWKWPHAFPPARWFSPPHFPNFGRKGSTSAVCLRCWVSSCLAHLAAFAPIYWVRSHLRDPQLWASDLGY